MYHVRRHLLGCLTLVCLATPTASFGQAPFIQFRTGLNGSSQVPPVQTTAKGHVAATYDPAAKRLSWKGDYAGLSGPATAAHVHGPAAAGANARLIVWISENSGQCSQGECRSKHDAHGEPLKSPFEGSATLTEAQAADLLAGLYYVNIHTDANPRGEIRGQLVKAPQSN